jgi:hypothetical protein
LLSICRWVDATEVRIVHSGQRVTALDFLSEMTVRHYAVGELRSGDTITARQAGQGKCRPSQKRYLMKQFNRE